MKLTTKGRFAVTAMLDIALHDPEEYVSIAAIGDRRHLSSAYLEQIFGKLRRAGLLEGVRGPAGGYRLAKPADQITVIDILEAVDDPLEKASCDKNRAVCDGEASGMRTPARSAKEQSATEKGSASHSIFGKASTRKSADS